MAKRTKFPLWGASLALVAVVAAAGLPAISAQAQPTIATPDHVAPERWSVRGEGVDLRVWVRRPEKQIAAVLFVHGRTWSALPNFDLNVPGENVSVLKSFASRGFAAYAMDLPGYGETPRGASGMLSPQEAAAAVRAVLTAIEAREKVKPVLVGYSRGSQVALLTSATYPDSHSMLVLYGFPGLGYASQPGAPLAPAGPRRAPTTLAAAASDFIVRDAASPAVVEAYAKAAVKADPIRMDWEREEVFATVDPSLVKAPTLLLQGVSDPIAVTERQAVVFARLGTQARGWTVLPGADHAAHVERAHGAWVAAIIDFFELNGGRR